MKHRRMRSASVTLGLTALVATALTGCSGDNDDPDYAAICVDPQTNQRLDDDKCDDDDREYDGHSGGFYWFYIPSHGSYNVPPVGGHYTTSGGTYRISETRGSNGKTATYKRGGVSKSGGTISNTSVKGFGGKSGSSGKVGGGGKAGS